MSKTDGPTNTGYPEPQPHDPITSIFEDVYWLHSTIRMAPGMVINRNMTVLRQGDELMLVNPVRMTADTQASLEALGTIRHVVRLGHFHTRDDNYYVSTYGAEFWCQKGEDEAGLPTATKTLTSGGELPFEDLEFFAFEHTKQLEGALLVKRHGGLLLTCDSVQNHAVLSHCSLLARIVMPIMGFKKRVVVGPPWKKAMTPPGGSLRPDFERLLELKFDHLLGAHGVLCRGGAHDQLRFAVQAAFR